jgi:hypothetical protein
MKSKYKGGSQTYKHFKFKSLRCSPKEKDKMNSFSCYTNDSLYKLRDLWNTKNQNNVINSNDPKEIHAKLTEYMKNICSKESCWIKQKKMFGQINSDIIDSFAPEIPNEWKKNPNEWLSSLDIINVMKQYENAYKCFKFIGPSPIDFDSKKMYGECVWNDLCNFSLKNQMKKGKNKIGIIFNTDPHDKPGSHWISLFINIKKKFIYFFDSTGDKPSNEIMKLVDRIIEQGHSISPSVNFKFHSNEGTEHQYGNTECGIYSLFFIIHMLQDKTPESFYKNHILTDKDVQHYRKIYFNQSL